VKTLAYRDSKKKKEKRSWDNIKNRLKDEYIKTREIAKETYQGIKKQINEEQPKKNIKNRKKKSIDLNLELFCPFCENPIPKELKPFIKDSKSIICENCGTEIKKNSFFKDYTLSD